MSEPTERRKIGLNISNQRAYVWEVQDIARIRSEHRLCGLLGGTLPHLAQQNVFLGVPLVLMPEEVVLLVENEAAVLIDDINAHHWPDVDEKQRWEEKDAAERSAQIAEKLKLKEIESTSNPRSMSEAAIRKRQEREAQRAAVAALRPTSSEAEVGELAAFTPEPTPSARSRSETPAAQIDAETIAYAITIPTSSNAVSWYRPDEHAYNTLAAAKKAGIWDFPSTVDDRARCGVFRALWEQGNYLGCGVKFGGEYLVYPGDPLRYHSHFVASVHSSPSSPLRPMEIVAHGRLGTATKKAHLLCTWDDEKRSVDIMSIEWSGFG